MQISWFFSQEKITLVPRADGVVRLEAGIVERVTGLAEVEGMLAFRGSYFPLDEARAGVLPFWEAVGLGGLAAARAYEVERTGGGGGSYSSASAESAENELSSPINASRGESSA